MHSKNDKVYQLLAHGWRFSLGTPASSTTKTGPHDIAEILLKVALNTKDQIRSTRLVIRTLGSVRWADQLSNIHCTCKLYTTDNLFPRPIVNLVGGLFWILSDSNVSCDGQSNFFPGFVKYGSIVAKD